MSQQPLNVPNPQAGESLFNTPEIQALNVAPSPAEAEALVNEFYADPVGFVQAVVDASAQQHLSTLRDEVELRAAMNAFWKKHADAKQFEPYVMQALGHVIATDEDGRLGPWDELLEKALELFQSQFGDMVKNHPDLQALNKAGVSPSASIESAQRRAMPKGAPSFTRKQIANMSPDEFAKNESAIEQAMRMGRIK